MNCIYPACPKHLKWKARNQWFPRRNGHLPVTSPLLAKDFGTWRRLEGNDSSYYTFVPDPKKPIDCYTEQTTAEECQNDRCRKHYRYKIQELRKEIEALRKDESSEEESQQMNRQQRRRLQQRFERSTKGKGRAN